MAGDRNHTLEAGVKLYRLSDDLPATTGGYLSTRLNPPDGPDRWTAEVVFLDRFDDTGTFVGVTNTHDWNPRWYTTVGLGGSREGFFWPRLRLDGSLNYRSPGVPGLVLSAGVGYLDYRTVYSDRTLTLGLTYYLTGVPWVVQASTTLNESNPGAVRARSDVLAVTYGREGERYLSLRLTRGRQGYLAVGPADFEVDFPFHGATVTWVEWVDPDWGFRAVADFYRSDAYDHWGFEGGVFWHF